MPETSILQKPEEKMLPKPKSKIKIILWVVVICIIVVTLIFGGFFVYKKYFSKEKEEAAEEEMEEIGEMEEEFIDETANWLVYKTDDFEIKYPSKEYESIAKKIEVKSKNAIVKEYDDWLKERQAEGNAPGPGPKGQLAGDKNLLNQQFEILSRVAKEEEISEELQKEIEDNFLLLSEAIDHKYYIDTIFSDNFETAGLNLIGYDSLDAANLPRFYYRVVFLVGDKIALIKFPLYPEAIEKKLMKDFGYNEKKGECDVKCSENMGNFFSKALEEIKEGEFEESLQDRIDTYDLIISTFKFLK